MSTKTALATQTSQPIAPVAAISPAAPQRKRALEVMAERLNLDPEKMMATLKATAFKGASNEEMAALVVVSNEYGLNPFLKEIYAFPAKGGGIVPVVGVDGWIKLLNRQPSYDGIEFEHNDSEAGKPISVTAKVYSKTRTRPVVVTEYHDECSRNTDPWNKSPRRMLRHKALIQAARVAFGFSGIYDEDEAQAITERPANAREVRARLDLSDADPLPANVAERTPEQGELANDLQVIRASMGDDVSESAFLSTADALELPAAKTLADMGQEGIATLAAHAESIVKEARRIAKEAE